MSTPPSGGPALLGNESLRAELARMWAEDRLHTCLIFEGPVGVGKASTARWLALLMNCQADEPARPCGTCWSCRQIHKGQHPDIVEIGLDPERTAPVISVEQARNVLGQLSVHPYAARRRLVIFDPADAMGQEAANALLKTLEEPPSSTGFIMVTSAASRLLPTVRSRSQRVRFGPVSIDVLAAWLEARGVAEAPALARMSDGCPGRALALAEGEVAAWREARDQLLSALAAPLSDLLTYTDGLTRGERGEAMPRVERALDALTRLAVDALRVRGAPSSSPPRPADLANGDRLPVVNAWAEALDERALARLSEGVASTRRDLEGFVNARLLMEALLTSLNAELGRARSAGASP